MERTTNDLILVRNVMTQLVEAGLAPQLFSGWAEELHGLAQPRTHQDVDLVLLDPPPAALDHFLATGAEVLEKRLSHKRVFLAGDVLVELFLGRWDGGCYQTIFRDRLCWRRPEAMVPW
jgi:hypothetical protein